MASEVTFGYRNKKMIQNDFRGHFESFSLGAIDVYVLQTYALLRLRQDFSL